MKVKFLTSLCGGEKDYHQGDMATINDAEAIRLIDAGFAEASPKKAYADVVVKQKQKQDKEDEKQQKMEAIMYEDELNAEKDRLLNRVDVINEILGIEDNQDEDENILEDDETIVPEEDAESGDGE